MTRWGCAEATSSEFGWSGSLNHPLRLAESQRQGEPGEASSGSGKLRGGLMPGDLGAQGAGGGLPARGHLCDPLGVRLWPSPTGAKLGTGAETREAASS